MKTRIALIAAVAVTGALAAAAYVYVHRPAPTGVLTLYGDTDRREVTPAFNDAGRVTRVLVQEGAVVKRGQLLATLDDARYGAALAQAKAQMAYLRQTLAKLQDGSRPEEIAEAQAAMNAAQAVMLNDQAVYRRNANLTGSGAVPVQQRDDAKAAADAAVQNYDAAGQAYALSVKGPRAEDIAAAQASYDAAVAAVALAQQEFNDTKLYAPADGVVEDRILEPGDMATAAAPVFTIALIDPLWVRAYVPESMLGQVRPGMAADVSTDSYPGHVYQGWVGYLSPTAEFTPQNVETPDLRTALVYQLRVYVCDPHGDLRLGMPATISLDVQKSASAPGCGATHAATP